MSRSLYCASLLLAFISVFFLVGIVGISYFIMLSFVALPLGLKAMRILWREYLSHEEVIPAQALTIKTLIAHGLLLSLSLGFSRQPPELNKAGSRTLVKNIALIVGSQTVAVKRER